MTQQPDPFSELRGLIERATPGPWRYRPRPMDDWGTIRGPNADAAVAIAACGHWDYDRVAAACRATATDPMSHNGLLIVAAVNALPALLDERDRLIGEVEGWCDLVVDTAEGMAELAKGLEEDGGYEATAREVRRQVALMMSALARQALSNQGEG